MPVHYSVQNVKLKPGMPVVWLRRWCSMNMEKGKKIWLEEFVETTVHDVTKKRVIINLRTRTGETVQRVVKHETIFV